MGREFDPHEMLTKKEMARLMRVSVREIDRRVKEGEMPPGRAYLGGRPRWPAFVAYYYVFAELVSGWSGEGEIGKHKSRQTPPNPAKPPKPAGGD
jgi:hypothetical protein